MCPRILFTLTLFLVESLGQSEVIGSTSPITAFQGDDVILPCHFEPQINMEEMRVEWLRKDVNRQVHLYDGTRDVENNDKLAPYVGRTMLFKDELRHGNISLKIKNVTLMDKGTFICGVPQLKSYDFIELTVVMCPSSTETISATVGRDTTVQLRAEGDYSLPMWKLNKSEIFFCRGGNPLPQFNKEVYDFEDRITASCKNATKGDGSFMIHSCQKNNSGLYSFCDGNSERCTCRHLEVKPMETTEEEKGSNTGGDGNNTTGLKIGLPVGVVLFCVVVGLVVWFCKKPQIQQQQGRRQNELI